MKLSDFDFELFERLIVTRPAVPRSSAKMLVATGTNISDHYVTDLPGFLRVGDRLVLNDTKVIPARLSGLRTCEGSAGITQAKVEVTLLLPRVDGCWDALIKPLKRVHDCEEIVFSSRLRATLEGRHEGQAILRFSVTGADFDSALDEAGKMPLPPYIASKRPADAADLTDYQTVWAKNAGAVVAPTASLYFDAGVLDDLKKRGVETTHVTLHVGAGTFLPVKVDDVSDHKMHSEWGEISAKAAAEINETKAAGGRIIPVGTTAL